MHLFLATSFFTTSLSLLKSKGKGINLLTTNLSILLFKLFKLVGTLVGILIHHCIYQYLINLYQVLN